MVAFFMGLIMGDMPTAMIIGGTFQLMALGVANTGGASVPNWGLAALVWLNPIYQFPLVDQGYDISDYYQINPMYGTMADFDQLLQKLHAANLKLIMDLVVNHTSSQHAWFRASKQDRTNPYADFYI